VLPFNLDEDGDSSAVDSEEGEALGREGHGGASVDEVEYAYGV